MTVHIALLRAVNVGGKNKIKMAELKQMFESLGYGRVETYIQSGNVVFEADEPEESLRQGIEHEIKSVFGLSVNVVLRTAPELEQVVRECPYPENSLADGESIYVTFLTDLPADDKMRLLETYKTEFDEYQVKGRDIYFLFRQRVSDSRLGMNLQKLGDHSTTRNWNTVNKLTAMARIMEGK